MFGKKCPKCNDRISSKSHFCQNCGAHLPHKKGKNDWGMLGKEDTNNFNIDAQFPKGLGMIFNSLMKNFEKQFKDFDNQSNFENPKNQKSNIRKGGISISISTSGNGPPQIKINSLGNNFQEKEKKDKTKEKALPSRILNI